MVTKHVSKTLLEELCYCFCDWLVIIHCHISLCVICIKVVLLAISYSNVTVGHLCDLHAEHGEECDL